MSFSDTLPFAAEAMALKHERTFLKRSLSVYSEFGVFAKFSRINTFLRTPKLGKRKRSSNDGPMTLAKLLGDFYMAMSYMLVYELMAARAHLTGGYSQSASRRPCFIALSGYYR